MTTSADKMTDANGNPEEPLEGTPAPTARVDAEDHEGAIPEVGNNPEGDNTEARISESANYDSVNNEGGTADNRQDTNIEPDTFPRSYVEELRQENGKYRQRAQRADDLAHRLHRSLVASTGRLQDPEDLEFNEAHLGDEEALTAAVDELLARKPHLGARKPRGDVGQGASRSGDSVDLAGLLRARA